MNYKAMWEELKAKINADIQFHKDGTMQSISESVHGEAKCKEFLGYMEKIEEAHKSDKTSLTVKTVKDKSGNRIEIIDKE